MEYYFKHIKYEDDFGAYNEYIFILQPWINYEDMIKSIDYKYIIRNLEYNDKENPWKFDNNFVFINPLQYYKNMKLYCLDGKNPRAINHKIFYRYSYMFCHSILELCNKYNLKIEKQIDACNYHLNYDFVIYECGYTIFGGIKHPINYDDLHERLNYLNNNNYIGNIMKLI